MFLFILCAFRVPVGQICGEIPAFAVRFPPPQNYGGKRR